MKPDLLTAAKAALEALETCDWNDNDFPDDTQYFDRFAVSEAATKLRAAIAEAERAEPVAVVVPVVEMQDYYEYNTGRLTIVPIKPMDKSGLKENDTLYLHPAAPTVPEGMMLVKRSDLAAACGMAGWNAYDRRCYLLLEKMLAAAPR